MPRVSPPGLEEIEAAARKLRGTVLHTPLLPYRGDLEDLFLKPETLQPVGSFKIRGIYHAVASMSDRERQAGLSTVSAGNTAQALAWAARHFGVQARAVMPETAPRTKIEAVERLGGEPVLVPRDEVFLFLQERRWEDEPYAFVHPWTDRRVITGHGSLGLEILDDLSRVRSVFVSVGGGGLLAGVGSALRARRPDVDIFAVEPAGCPALHAALQRGRPVEVDCRTLCDGIAVPYITDEMFPLLRDLVTEVILVEEWEVRRAIRDVALEHKLIVEGAAAISLAAARKVPRERRGPSVVVLSGGSLDRQVLVEILTEEPA